MYRAEIYAPPMTEADEEEEFETYLLSQPEARGLSELQSFWKGVLDSATLGIVSPYGNRYPAGFLPWLSFVAGTAVGFIGTGFLGGLVAKAALRGAVGGLKLLRLGQAARSVETASEALRTGAFLTRLAESRPAVKAALEGAWNEARFFTSAVAAQIGLSSMLWQAMDEPDRNRLRERMAEHAKYDPAAAMLLWLNDPEHAAELTGMSPEEAAAWLTSSIIAPSVISGGFKWLREAWITPRFSRHLGRPA